jgi:CRISPR-associated protein Csb1
MAEEVTLESLLSVHKLLDPDGPVCLIVQATMGIAAGLDRFQPAGFPEIGHVIYDAPRKGGAEKVCIVDSPASMANHLEQVCQAGENDPSLHDALIGLPHVRCVTDRDPVVNGGSVTPKVDDPRDKLVATTLTEGHRLASDYFLDGHRVGADGEPAEATFRDELRQEFGVTEVKKDKTYFITPEAWWTIYGTLFRYDPNSLVHGVLFAKEQIKISRLLTAHLEAFGASRVGRSGVKFDRLGKTTSGQPIFAVDEETAREIKATFIIDLAMLRSYGRQLAKEKDAKVLGLSPGQKKLLLALSLWKVRELLRRTFSYRSGCKLRMQSVTIRTDDQQDTESIATGLPAVDMAVAIREGFPVEKDRVTTSVYYPYGDLFKPSRDEAASRGADDDESDTGNEGEG